MKEQIISERANIIANLRQLVQSLVELNTRAKTHVSSNKADIKKLRKDNTEFNATPLYSYRVIKDKAIDVVFDNKHIGNGDGFMRSLEDNILEPRIYDLIKEESRKYKTDTLMADGGSLAFEKKLEDIVRAEFKDRGLDLKSFSAQLEFSDRVREKIDNRNEVNTNISVIDQKIEEQKKQNELERLKTEQALITSKGLTKEILYKQFIDKWDGKTPLYGVIPEFLKMTN